MGLPHGGEIIIVGRTMWTQSTSVTGQTQTDRITITKTAQSVAERRTVKTDKKNCNIPRDLRSFEIRFEFESAVPFDSIRK